MNNQNDPQVYNGYGNVNQPYSYPQYNSMQYGNMQQQTVPDRKKNRNYASMVFGLVSMVLLIIGVFAPAIDFSAYHASVQIQYSFMKICQNVGLISAMWMGIPYGILIAAVIMGALSFVDIPQLKIIPSVIVIMMIVLMIVDVGNVVDWVLQMIERFADTSWSISDNAGDAAQVIKSFMAGVYCLAAGLITGIISCFVKRRDA